MKMNFIHLRNYSTFSFLNGINDIESMVIKHKEMGFKALAMTDVNGLFGLADFIKISLKHKIIPIIGIEIEIICETHVLKCIILIKNQIGYQKFLKILNAHYEGYDDDLKIRPIDISLIADLQDDIFVILIDLIDNIFSFGMNIFEHTINKIKNKIHKNLFIEILRNDVSEINSPLEKSLLNLATMNKIPIVATSKNIVLEKEDYKYMDMIFCIKNNYKFYNKNRPHHEKNIHIKNHEEIEELYHDIPEAIENTIKIGVMCSWFPESKEISIPYTSERDDYILKENTLLQLFEFIKNFDDDKKNIYINQYLKEILVIKKLKFSRYFIIIKEIIDYCKDNDILVGPGRGSGAGSLINFLLGITKLDPIKHGLFFERFLNQDRIEMPDLDIDFCKQSRNSVIQYMVNRWGSDHVAHIVTYSKLQPRAILRDMGRAMGLSFFEINNLTQYVPIGAAKFSLKEIYEQDKNFRELIQTDSKYQSLLDFCYKGEGILRQPGVHAAGIIISENILEETIPMFNIQHHIAKITEIDMTGIGYFGLIKFDILGLKALTIIDLTIKEIQNNFDKNYKFDFIEEFYDDSKVYDFILEHHLIGIFQLETKGITDVIKKAKVKSIEDISTCIALFRPGPLKYIPEYIKAKENKSNNNKNKTKIDDILSNTYGVLIYQEQIMSLAHEIAGFTKTEADIFRKIIAKKQADKFPEQQMKFINGCINNGMTKEEAKSLADKIEGFALYGFNKAHSVSYASIAYIMAKFKLYYPICFLLSCINTEIKNIDKISAFIHNANALNIQILPPCINNSDKNFKIETINNKKYIRWGLSGIKSINDHYLNEIIRNRNENGKYKNFRDFLNRNFDSKSNIINLIICGAFHDFNKDIDLLINEYKKGHNYNILSKTTQIDNLYVDMDAINVKNKKYYGKMFELMGCILMKPSIHKKSLIKEPTLYQMITDKNDQQINIYKIKVMIMNINKSFKMSKLDKNTIKLIISDDTAIITLLIYDKILSDKIINKYEIFDIVTMILEYNNNKHTKINVLDIL